MVKAHVNTFGLLLERLMKHQDLIPGISVLASIQTLIQHQLFLVLLEMTTSVILPKKPSGILDLTFGLFKSVILSGMERGVAPPCTSTCCYDPQRKVNPPWFVKTLSSPTSDDIEMRLCTGDYKGVFSTPIEIVELYVQ